MKPTFADLRAQCPDIPEPVLNEYLARLDENYFAVFSLPQMQAHLYALERLRPEHPMEVIFELGLEGQTACTVLAFDYPAEFSLITGVLSAMGFDILSGDVFTYARAKAEAVAPRRRRSESNDEVLLKRRKIIDRFSGVIRHDLGSADWRREFSKRLEEVIGLLEAGSAEYKAEAHLRQGFPLRLKSFGGQVGGQATYFPHLTKSCTATHRRHSAGALHGRSSHPGRYSRWLHPCRS